MKLAINLMIAVLAQVMSEALVLGEAAGVSRAALLDVMGSSAAGAPFVKYKTEPLLRDDFSATFTTALMEKDIDLVLDAAGEAGVELPLAREMKTHLRAAIDAGYADDDFIALFLHLRSASGLATAAAPPARVSELPRPGGRAVTTRSEDRRLPRRNARGRLGAAHRLPAAAPGPPRPRQGGARGVRPRSGAALRPEQHPIRHEHAHRRVGAGQERAVRAARRAAPSRSCGTSDPPPATTSCSRRGSRRRTSAPASRRCAVRCPSRPGSRTGSAAKIAHELRELGLQDEPLGIDMADLVTIEALQRAGVHVTDGSQVLLEARKIKTAEEIALLDQSAGLVDAVYEEIYRMLRPGVYEHEIVARAHQLLFEMGSEQVEAVNAVSGDRCNPHPHVFSDRLLRPGDQAFFDIIHSFMGYRTCYYRTFNVGGVSHAQLDAYKQCREWLDAAIALVRPGMTTDKIAEVWPTAEELGFPDEETCFGLQFGHGIGVGLYESPMISRVHSLEHPVELEEGMVFALETYCAATDGRSAARIEEEVVVTATGCDVITRFPADELLVAGRTTCAAPTSSRRATRPRTTATPVSPLRSRPLPSSSPPAFRDERRDRHAPARGRAPGVPARPPRGHRARATRCRATRAA